MTGTTWIVVGIIALAFSGFAIPYGFHLKSSEKASTLETTTSSSDSEVKKDNSSRDESLSEKLTKKALDDDKQVPQTKVFLSSTSEDLKVYRNAVYESLSKIPSVWCIRREDFGSIDAPLLDAILSKLSKCDVMIGIAGFNYGKTPIGHEKSFSQIEYEEAKKNGVYRMMFLANKDFSDSEELKESDDKRLKQKTFRKLIEENVTPEYFKYPGDLVKKVKMSLANNLKNGVRLSLKEGSYDVQITTTKGTETYEENVKGGVLYFPVQDSDTLVKRIVIIDNSTLKEHVYDFTDGTIPFEVTVRNPRFVEVGHYEKALQLDSTTTNYLLNSDSPESQSHALAEGEYILWIKGEGKVVVSASVSGEATEKKPFRFKLYERGPIYLKVVGKVDRFQLEQGTVATAFISTENATVTRIGSQLAISAENL